MAKLALWATVLETAVADSVGEAKSGTAQAERRQAREWLSKPGRDLAQVLAWLDIEPSWWHSRVVPALRAKWADPPWLVERIGCDK